MLNIASRSHKDGMFCTKSSGLCDLCTRFCDFSTCILLRGCVLTSNRGLEITTATATVNFTVLINFLERVD